MNSQTPPPAGNQPRAPSGSKTLWAATLVLVVVVLAMGATLIRIQSHLVEPRMAVLPEPAPAASDTPHDDTARTGIPATNTTPDATGAAPTAASAAGPVNVSGIEQNRPQALIDKSQTAINNEAIKANDITAKPRPVLPRQPEPAVLRPPEAGVSNTLPAEPLQTLPR